MKHVLFAVALIAGTLSLTGSATAASPAPKTYADNNTLIAFTRASQPLSPGLAGVTNGGHAPRVVIKGGHQVAGPVHAKVMFTESSGYLDQAAPGVQFTYIKTYFNVPSVNDSSGCNGNPADGSVIQAVGLDYQGAGVAEVGCNGVTTADFIYNVAGYGAFYYSGVNPGDAVEASVTFNRASEYVLQVKDLSTGGLLKVTIGCHVSSCPNSTASVLSSAQNLTGGVVPDFTMINYTGSAVRANFGEFKGNLATKCGKWKSETLEEHSPSVVTPSALQGGQAFSNTWVS